MAHDGDSPIFSDITDSRDHPTPTVSKAVLEKMAALKPPVTPETLITSQKYDTSLSKCFSSRSKSGELESCLFTYFLEDGVLMHKWKLG